MNSARLCLAVLVAVLGSAVCDLDLCQDGFQDFQMYSDIWQRTKSDNAPPYALNLSDAYTVEYLEEYVNHICSTVKPLALDSFRRELNSCSNLDQLTAMLDHDEGFCRNGSISTRIEISIIQRLPAVNNHIVCERITRNSDCYQEAARKLEKHLPIKRFRKEIDKFYARIWQCQVKLFKTYSGICPNWQLPMLLSLDKMNVLSLFRIKLTDRQIAMLGLGGVVPKGTKPGHTKKGGGRTTKIGGGRKIKIGGGRKTKIGGGRNTKIGGGRKIKIGGGRKIKIGGGRKTKIGGGRNTYIGGGRNTKTGGGGKKKTG